MPPRDRHPPLTPLALALTLALAIGAAPTTETRPPGADAASDDARDPSARLVSEAETLLDEDRFEDALIKAGAAVELEPEHASAHVVKAGALYRRGDFDEAEHHYRRAVDLDPNHAAAHFGVGRILRTLGRYGEAGAAFGRAAALSPDTPRYLRVLANHLSRREDTVDMLRRYIELVNADPESDEKATIGNVEAWIQLLEMAGDRPLSQPVRMEPTEVAVSVNRGQVYMRMDVAEIDNQRFVFDTGATGMTVSPRLARRAKLESIGGYTIAGTGAGRTETGDLVLLPQIALGEGILIKNVPATVRQPSGPEVGLLGPSLFSRMAITFDPRRKRLVFDKMAGERDGHVEPFRNVGGEIVIQVLVNGVPFNAMIDTGASTTIIGRTTLSRLPDLQATPGEWYAGTAVGVGGPMADRKVVIKGTLTIAGKEFPADGLLSGNLDGFSRSLESEIYVILGMTHLDEFVMTIDYDAMTVTFVDRGKG